MRLIARMDFMSVRAFLCAGLECDKLCLCVCLNERNKLMSVSCGVIPKVRREAGGEGVFVVSGDSKIIVERGLEGVGEYLADVIKQRCGVSVCVEVGSDGGGSDARGSDVRGGFLLSVDEKVGGDEEYELVVDEAGVSVRGSGAAGVFYGVQTLRQLIGGDGRIGCVRIEDGPGYGWRGFMLDCSRHFMSKEFVKRYIDLIACLKMNRFHWHLTDDEGWRIEIEKYPALTGVGSCCEEGEEMQGYYSKEDIREVVEYARERHVEVVPEIDMPGHSLAVMRSYPELCCTGEPVKNEYHQKDLYCAGSERVFEFIEDVLTEVMEMFDCEYLHVGGDEAPKERWEACEKCQKRIRDEGLGDEEGLQGYFIGRIARFLARRGRRLIGWEEIVDGEVDLPSDVVVQWWQHRVDGAKGLTRGVQGGHDVIVSPNSYCYLSFPLRPEGRFGVDRTSDLRKVYEGEMVSGELSEEERGRVMGCECCLWTELLKEEDIDKKVFPRILASAERFWVAGDDKGDFDEFYGRVKGMYGLLDEMRVRYGDALSDE